MNEKTLDRLLQYAFHGGEGDIRSKNYASTIPMSITPARAPDRWPGNLEVNFNCGVPERHVFPGLLAGICELKAPPPVSPRLGLSIPYED